jgi:hypothetical protein
MSVMRKPKISLAFQIILSQVDYSHYKSLPIPVNCAPDLEIQYAFICLFKIENY